MQKNNKTVVGVYDTRGEALDVVHKLKDAGYQKQDIILYANETVTSSQNDHEAVNVETDTTAARDTNDREQSLWEQIKDAFSSDTYDYDERTTSTDYNAQEDLLYPYRDDIRNGKIVVVVDNYRGEDLDVYTTTGTTVNTGQETTTATVTDETTLERSDNVDNDNINNPERANRTDVERTDRLKTTDVDTTDETLTEKERLRLKEEELDVDTNEVKTGEVNVHKEVVKDTETVEVPVEHEEVVVERKPVNETDRTATDDINTDENISIPVKEEQIEVTKKPVVKEEVEVKKDTHTDTKQVSEEVRHEELDVDTDGDVRVENNTGKTVDTNDTKKKR